MNSKIYIIWHDKLCNIAADNYLESEKKIINSLQSAWLPQIEAANRAFTSNWTVSPRQFFENYALQT